MGFNDMFQSLFWGRRDLDGPLGRRPPARPLPRRSGPPQLGQRVLLRQPIASPHRVFIPEGAAGVVIGGDARARQVSVELDAPRTVITVPWAWVEDEPPEPPPGASGPGDPPAAG
jgi:hypothetical protein